TLLVKVLMLCSRGRAREIPLLCLCKRRFPTRSPQLCGISRRICASDNIKLLERRVVCWKGFEKTDASTDLATCRS
ncbi:hypothetical protein A2U01_0085606, partial [Trifolium medium]|nr:hypothetical protein [Trifolium medium]